MMLFQFIVLQIIVFGAVIYFLKKIFYGDTESAIKRLGHVYEDMLKKQTELQQKNEALEKEIKQKGDEAAKLSEKFKAEAMVEIQKKEDETLKQARAQAEEIISKAQGSREDMAKEIESQVSKKTIHFAAEVIKKALTERIIQQIHGELILDFIKKAKDLELSGGSAGEAFVIRSPIPLKKEESDKINALLASKLSRVVQFNEVLDTDLVAGIAMQFGSMVLDGSLSSLLHDASEKVQEKY